MFLAVFGPFFLIGGGKLYLCLTTSTITGTDKEEVEGRFQALSKKDTLGIQSIPLHSKW